MSSAIGLLLAALLVGGLPADVAAKSYSSGGSHSYSSSSHSSSGSSHSFSSGGSSHGSGGGSSGGGGSHHSSSSSSSDGGSSSGGSGSHSSASGGGSKSFKSGSGTSYSSGNTSSDQNRHSYSSAKSYTSGAGNTFSSGNNEVNPSRKDVLSPPLPNPSPRAAESKLADPSSSSSGFAFDTSAARARKEAASRQEFNRFQESSRPAPNRLDPASGSPVGASPNSISRSESAPAGSAPTPSYRVGPPPLPPSATGSYRRQVYIPDGDIIVTRPTRSYTVFYPYVSRPLVTYRDPYSSFFWWWLLDRSLDDRAMWACHHRYDMDPARYQALVADNQQLAQRITQLEAQQVAPDPKYTPPGLDRDLMYSDQHVTRAYANRPTPSGKIVFWVLAIPLIAGAGCFFVWFIFFKRWQPST